MHEPPCARPRTTSLRFTPSQEQTSATSFNPARHGKRWTLDLGTALPQSDRNQTGVPDISEKCALSEKSRTSENRGTRRKSLTSGSLPARLGSHSNWHGGNRKPPPGVELHRRHRCVLDGHPLDVAHGFANTKAYTIPAQRGRWSRPSTTRCRPTPRRRAPHRWRGRCRSRRSSPAGTRWH